MKNTQVTAITNLGWIVTGYIISTYTDPYMGTSYTVIEVAGGDRITVLTTNIIK
mgnify:CR=1 FL=1